MKNSLTINSVGNNTKIKNMAMIWQVIGNIKFRSTTNNRIIKNQKYLIIRITINNNEFFLKLIKKLNFMKHIFF